jgi:membrane fusion protein (multidrug efflux system)
MTVPVRNALVIPQKSTFEIQEKKYVFVVDGNGTVKSRNISIVNEMPDLYVVGNGLSESDRILLEGVQKVKDDDKIKVQLVNPKEALSQLKLHAE